MQASSMHETAPREEEQQRTTNEDTRSIKRLKTKHKKHTTTSITSVPSSANDDSSENDTTKNKRVRGMDTNTTPEQLDRANGGAGGTGEGTEEDNNDKRVLDTLGNMEKIEKEFADLKEKLFKDKIMQLKKEIEAIKNGTHAQFCEQCKMLDDIRNEKISNAEQWKQYQLQNINNMFEAERQQAEEECRNEKRQLKDRLINSILEKKKKITEEKQTLNLTDSTENNRINTRQLRRRGQPPPPPSHVRKKTTRI